VSEVLLLGHVDRLEVPARLASKFDVVPMLVGPTREDGAFRSDVTRIRNLAGPKWNAMLYDLLTVMCTLRAADRYFRSRDVFAMGRQLHIAATVHDAARWRVLAAPLKHAVYRLSYDRLDFHPIALRRRARDSRPITGATSPLEAGYRPDCVCLFSGGADSFCGAAHLLANGRRPLFVSVSIGGVAGRQKVLFDAIRRRFSHVPRSALVQLTPWPNAFPRGRRPAKGWQHRDSLQRLRAIFFLSLAAMVGHFFDLDDVFMCENGVVGAAIVFAPAYDNASTTRPSEPHFLRALEAFLQAALDAPAVRLRNPFQYKTKGEVLRETAKLGLAKWLPQTVSCWRSGNQGIVNCGACVPCLFRQLAFDESGLPQRGRYKRAAIPPRAWQRWKSSELPRLAAIREYSLRAMREGTRGLEQYEPAVMDAIDVTGGPASRAAVGKEEQQRLDDEAQARMAATILRFARATAGRLR